jgi:hypothetical protein
LAIVTFADVIQKRGILRFEFHGLLKALPGIPIVSLPEKMDAVLVVIPKAIVRSGDTPG